MYCVDKAVFQKSTGVDFDSEKGLFFRQLAVKSLAAFMEDVSQQSFTNRALAHRLKGIASTCGSMEAAYLCKKFEQYSDVLNEPRVRLLFIEIATRITYELEQ